MLAILVTMLLIVVLATLVLAYVTFPHRRRDVPRPDWLFTALAGAVERVRPDQAEQDRQRIRTPASSG